MSLPRLRADSVIFSPVYDIRIMLFSRDEFALKATAGFDLYTLLRKTLNIQATDPRDKIFALLSLTDERIRASLVPDYSLSIAQVLTKATKFVIAETRSLNPLCWNGLKSVPLLQDDTLPSWVQSFTNDFHGSQWPRNRYNASLERVAPILPNIDEQTNILKVRGIVIDKVKTVSSAALDGFSNLPREQMSQEAMLNELRLAVSDWEEMLLRHVQAWSKDGDMEDLRTRISIWMLNPDPKKCNAFWRTLVADMGSVGGTSIHTLATRQWGELFESQIYNSPKAVLRRESCGLNGHLQRTVLKAAVIEKLHPAGEPDLDDISSRPKSEVLHEFQALFAAMGAMLVGRRFFITENHRMGITQTDAKPCDNIAVLKGCEMPLILRDVPQSDEKLLVGECFVQGVMNGEAASRCSCSGEPIPYRVFKLR